MDREKLIRTHFDAYSDLIWVKDSEPKFREYGLDAAEMRAYREAWNRHTEARDWEWWLDKVKGCSNAELQEDIAGCRVEIEAIRKERPKEHFQQILDRPSEKSERRQEPERHQERKKGREM